MEFESFKKNYVERIEYNHILDAMNRTFAEDLPRYNFSRENMKTFAVTSHPHFSIWCCALVLAGLGGDITKENAEDEVFGGDQFHEGPHSMLALNSFSQLGDYEIHHYRRCFEAVKKVYSYCNREKINVLYAMIIAIETAGFLIPGLGDGLKREREHDPKVNNFIYVEAHMEADNLEDGHGIRLLQELESNTLNEGKVKKMTVEEFNEGLQLFRYFFLNIFDYDA